jgi:hypothetical protein
MFCGKDESLGKMSREHFVPKCLWEKGHRPKRVKTVLAHKSCNEAFSDDNEYFRNVLVLENGATDRCLGAQVVCEGTIQRMLSECPGTIKKAARDVKLTPAYTRSGLYIGEHPSYSVDLARIERVLSNVIRGVFYLLVETPMPADFQFWIQDVQAMDIKPYERVISDMVPWQSFGDNVFQCRYRVLRRPEPVGIDCLMAFYQNRYFFGQAVSPDYAQHWIDRLFIPSSANSNIVVPYWAHATKKTP